MEISGFFHDIGGSISVIFMQIVMCHHGWDKFIKKCFKVNYNLYIKCFLFKILVWIYFFIRTIFMIFQKNDYNL